MAFLPLLGLGDDLSMRDLALLAFFGIVAIVKVVEAILRRRGSGRLPEDVPEEVPEEAAPERKRPRRAPPPVSPEPVPAPASRPVRPTDLEWTPTGKGSSLRDRPTEVTRAAAAAVSGRALLLGEALSPHDRIRQAVLWSEVLRRPRRMTPPPRRRES